MVPATPGVDKVAAQSRAYPSAAGARKRRIAKLDSRGMLARSQVIRSDSRVLAATARAVIRRSVTPAGATARNAGVHLTV
jgi:hypothetical protein